MNRETNTFSVFISSPFNDFKEEREALRRRVFPCLARFCRERGARFSPVDLRYGISEEASADQSAMQVCLMEIDRCRKLTPSPNFLLLLGERYGTRPLPTEIPEAEYAEIRALFTLPGVPSKNLRLLDSWYFNGKDENAVPAVYRLASRKERAVGRDAWKKIECDLSEILGKAVEILGYPEDKRRKYTASATELEVAHRGLLGEAYRDHLAGAFAFFRTIENLPDDVRASKFVDLDKHGCLDKKAANAIGGLKEKLRRHLSGNVQSYVASWNGTDVSDTYIDKFCDDVHSCLQTSILAELERDREQYHSASVGALHNSFATERLTSFVDGETSIFIGRQDALAAIDDYLTTFSPDNGKAQPFFVLGSPGSGKTTLAAKARQEAYKKHKGAEIICRFIGAIPESTNLLTLLQDLCQEILDRYRPLDRAREDRAEGQAQVLTVQEQIPTDPYNLVKFFRNKCLTLATAQMPMIMFLDAIDQLSPEYDARGLRWLPKELPENVHVVVTVATDAHECLKEIVKVPESYRYHLRPMTKGDGEALLVEWLQQAKRRLTIDQHEAIRRAFADNGTPLFLRLVFEQARHWVSSKSLTELRLPSKTRDVIHGMLDDLERPERHGPAVVSGALSSLAAAKNGLSWDEHLDLLSRDRVVMKPLWEDSQFPIKVGDPLPTVIWSRLFLDLRPYLVERSIDGVRTIEFYHRQLQDHAKERYLPASSRIRCHRYLACFFGRQDYKTVEVEGQAIYNLRKLSEWPFQLVRGELWRLTEKTFLDFDFLQAKVSSGGLISLIEDLDRPWSGLTTTIGDALKDTTHIRDLRNTLVLSSHTVSGDGTQLPGQLICRLLGNAHPKLRGLIKDAERGPGRPWLCPQTNSLAGPGSFVLRILRGHMDNVNALAVLPDGRVLSASDDKTLRLWDVDTGVEIRRFEGHLDRVTAVVAFSNGRAISGSADNTLRLWDVETGEEIRCIEGPTGALGGIESVVVLGDGRVLSSASDYTLRLWDVESGKELRRFEGHEFIITAVIVLPDGRRALSASGDETFRLWDLETGAKLASYPACEPGCWSLEALPDGRVVSGWSDNTIRMWDVETGEECGRFEGHAERILALAVLPNGRLLSGSRDSTLRLWNVETRTEIRRFEGHVGGINAIAVLSDRQAVSGSEDNTMRFWDISEETASTRANIRLSRITALTVIPDGRLLAGHEDGKLRLWDVQTGAELAALEGEVIESKDTILSEDTAIDDSNDDPLPVDENGTDQSDDTVPSAQEESHSQHEIPSLEELEQKYGTGLKYMRRNLAIGFKQIVDLFSKDIIDTVAVLPDGFHALSGSRRGIVRLWELRELREVRYFTGHKNSVTGVAVLPDGRVLSGSNDFTMRVWDSETGQELTCLKEQGRAIAAMALLPNSRALTANDKNLRIWDLETGKELCSLEGHTGDITSVAVFSDGRRAISGGRDRTLRLWDLDERRQIWCSEGHARDVTSVAVLPQRRLAVSGSLDTTCQVWNLENGEMVAKFIGDDSISCVAAARDDLFVAGSNSGVIHLLLLRDY
jgi:WD40 repeat protein